MTRSEFFNPRVHIGWMTALLLALIGKGIVMYSSIAEIQHDQESMQQQIHELHDDLHANCEPRR